MAFPKTIEQAQALMREGNLHPRDLVDVALAQIERHESDLQAWVNIDAESAKDQAERLAKQDFESRGWLWGIPVGVKDIFDIADQTTQAGSPVRERSPAATQNAVVVDRWRNAGAIILGKTVTTEFACFDPPPTRNPWNLAHTPGGSSSGSAAAIAAGNCFAALGSQTGGSIVRPASYCGVVGLKPTFGAIPVEGVFPISANLDHVGPLAGNVSDLRAAWFAMQSTPPLVTLLNNPANDFRENEFVGIHDFFQTEADSDVLASFQETLNGLSLETFVPSKCFEEILKQHLIIMSVECAAVHRDNFQQTPELYGPNITSLIETGLATSADDYQAALQHQVNDRKSFAAQLGDLIALTPATDITAPLADTTGSPRFQSVWSYLGLPTITIPCSLSSEGLPCGLQLIGAPHTETRLLNAAAWWETRIGFNAHPPCWPEA